MYNQIIHDIYNAAIMKLASVSGNIEALYNPRHPDHYRAIAENISREAPKFFESADKFRTEHPNMTPEQRKGFEENYNEIKRQIDWAKNYLAGLRK